MLIITWVKFLHVMFAMVLIGSIFFCFSLTQKITEPSTSQKNVLFSTLQKIIISMSVFAGITGSLLIYPKHYTIHTHWIITAYLLLTGFILLIIYAHKIRSRTIWLGFCTLCLCLLIAIVHDAVLKQTFF